MDIQDIEKDIGVQFPVVLTKDERKRAKAGAKFMDQISDGITWADEIALTQEEADVMGREYVFFIGDSDRCVLGSVFGPSFAATVSHLFDGEAWRQAALGFNTYYEYHEGTAKLSSQMQQAIRAGEWEDDETGWSRLQEAWHYEISVRKGKLAQQRKHTEAKAVCQDETAREV